MPYFGVGADASVARPPVMYRQPPQHHTRGRLGQSLSDILGDISDVAGTVSADVSNPSASYSSLPPSYYSAPVAAPATSGFSTTTVLLAVVAVGGLIYLGTRKKA